ncbi:hypothetical protein Mal33_44460 [Rosistilla oblonga]|uniref:Uncharacterized protein n=1 Tax=Rosistilla oblonga TaxID=2527990 RepID=A0A518IZF7_9BACT|nr:hypothetical protein Mal33_44460 [Rosistilla oblonga]
MREPLNNLNHLHRTVFVPLALCAAILLAVPGCGRLMHQLIPPSPPTSLTVNPAMLPAVKPDFLWLQVVDTVDDYFRIKTEQPLNGIDGSLETTYRVGASLLEPWNRDSTRGFERLQSTLQSIRRKAIVNVHAQQSGYSIEVVVLKEIEDVDHSQGASEGSLSLRHDGTVTRSDEIFTGEPITLGWIPLGRDTSLEQVILNEILDHVLEPDRKKLLHH